MGKLGEGPGGGHVTATQDDGKRASTRWTLGEVGGPFGETWEGFGERDTRSPKITERALFHALVDAAHSASRPVPEPRSAITAELRSSPMPAMSHALSTSLLNSGSGNSP